MHETSLSTGVGTEEAAPGGETKTMQVQVGTLTIARAFGSRPIGWSSLARCRYRWGTSKLTNSPNGPIMGGSARPTISLLTYCTILYLSYEPEKNTAQCNSMYCTILFFMYTLGATNNTTC